MLMLYVLLQVLMQNLYNKTGNLPVESVCLFTNGSVKFLTGLVAFVHKQSKSEIVFAWSFLLHFQNATLAWLSFKGKQNRPYQTENKASKRSHCFAKSYTKKDEF